MAVVVVANKIQTSCKHSNEHEFDSYLVVMDYHGP
jgi:hypothetical protein